MAKAYSVDLRTRVINNYISGMSKEDIVKIFTISFFTLNRWITEYDKTGSVEPKKRTKHRERKFSDSELIKHADENSSPALEERARYFSVKPQSIHARLKNLGTTRKKNFYLQRNGRKKAGEIYQRAEGC